MKHQHVIEEFREIIQKHWHSPAGEFISPSRLVDELESFILTALTEAEKRGREEVLRKIEQRTRDPIALGGSMYGNGWKDGLLNLKEDLLEEARSLPEEQK